MNKKSKKSKKGAPLLLLVLLTIGAIAVGAALVNLWTSQQITYQFTVEGIIDARALDARFGDGSIGYSGEEVATVLRSDTIGVAVSRAFVIVIDDTNVGEDVNLDLDVVVKRYGIVQSSATWTATTSYVCYWYDSASVPQVTTFAQGPGTMTEAAYTLTIPNAEVSTYMDYYLRPATVSGSPLVGDCGGLLIEFSSIDGNGGWGAYTVEIIATLSADAGS